MIIQASSSKTLMTAISKSLKCTTAKPSLAILENILISQKSEGHLVLISSNGESQLTVPAPLFVVKGKFIESLAIPAKLIVSFLQTLPDCSINFEFVDGGTSLYLEYCIDVDGKAKKGKASLTYLSGADFPLLNSVEKPSTVLTLPDNVFLPALANLSDFLSDDFLRPVMNNACIDIAEDLSDVVFVGTDGQKLVKQTYSSNDGTGFNVKGRPNKILVNKKSIHILSVFSGCGEVMIESDGKKVRYSCGDVEYISSIVEGKYPNYNSVIPKDSSYYLVVNKKELIEIIKRITLFGNPNSKLLVLEKNGDMVNISSQDIDYSHSAKEEISIKESECIDGFRIGFNWNIALSSVSAIPGEMIRIRLLDASRPAVITSDEPSPNILSLMMPMMIDD